MLRALLYLDELIGRVRGGGVVPPVRSRRAVLLAEEGVGLVRLCVDGEAGVRDVGALPETAIWGTDQNIHYDGMGALIRGNNT